MIDVGTAVARQLAIVELLRGTTGTRVKMELD